MKKNLSLFIAMLFAVVFTTNAFAQKDDWQPTAQWPLVYANFMPADVYTTANKKVFARSNIHVGMHCLWFINGSGEKLAAKEGTISKVVFRNGDQYYNINEKMCKVLREDTIKGKVCRLYISTELDKDRFNEMARINGQGMMDLGGLTIGLTNLSNEVANQAGASNVDAEPLPVREKFYMLYDGETFEATQRNILNHLTKEERAAYRAFERSAEIVSGHRRSIENVWITFFVNK